MILGIDLGMGACKLYGEAGGIHLPSHVAIAEGRVVGRLAGMKAAKPPLKVTVDGHSFYVGDGAHEWGRPVESLDYERLSGSPEIKAIVYGALTRYAILRRNFFFAEPLTLYVGMPLEPLTGEPERVKATVTAVRDWLRGRHEWQFTDSSDGFGDGILAAEIGEVKITSQPTGALFDYLLDDNGRFHSDRKGHMKKEIGIISVGFNTVELLVVQDARPVQRFTAGTTAGVRRLLDLVNGDGLYSLGELDTQLRSGSLDIKSATPIWAREVSGAIERTWGQSWRRFARVVTVGGGAIILNGQLAFQGRAFVPDAPVMAIARGLFKMGAMKGG